MLKRSLKSFFFPNLLLALVSTVLTVLAIEGLFRVIGFDFEAGRERAFMAYPICYRQPRKPLGDVFFHRYGPATWTGQVLATGLRNDGGLGEAYVDEPEVTITYDAEGFRNPDTLAHWTLVVVGDSFVEQGYLPYEDLFTTQLGRLLGVPVKNAGAGYSGPLSYVAYLQHFGAAPGARHAVMIFFEGNDLIDLERETQWTHLFAATGKREYRDFKKQPSFLRAGYRFLARRMRGEHLHKRFFRNAYFAADDGEVAVSVSYTPPAADAVSPSARHGLGRALAAWAATADTLGMKPWLVYMPCKRRVLHERLRFIDETPQDFVDWRPTDLPAWVKQQAETHGIGFIDVTPVLLRETRQGRLTYNPIWDTHLNRRGSALVAEVLADTLRHHLD